MRNLNHTEGRGRVRARANQRENDEIFGRATGRADGRTDGRPSSVVRRNLLLYEPQMRSDSRKCATGTPSVRTG